jgi:hypothetical protein
VAVNLIQVLLPLYSSSGRRISGNLFAETREELVERFGGLTAYTSAAKGFWKTRGKTERDDVVLFEVMASRPNKRWWQQYRKELEKRVAPRARRGALQDLQAFVRNHQKASGAGSVQSGFTEVVGNYLAKRAQEL